MTTRTLHVSSLPSRRPLRGARSKSLAPRRTGHARALAARALDLERREAVDRFIAFCARSLHAPDEETRTALLAEWRQAHEPGGRYYASALRLGIVDAPA